MIHHATHCFLSVLLHLHLTLKLLAANYTIQNDAGKAEND